MKTALLRALTAAKRAIVYFQMRSVEIHLASKLEVLERVTNPYTRHDMRHSIQATRLELDRLRTDYIALRTRSSWRLA